MAFFTLQLMLVVGFVAGASAEGQDCISDGGEFDETCLETCTMHSGCGEGYSCQKAPCGRCRCFLDTGPEPDCCFDEGSFCSNECRFHANCSSNQLCKPEQGCSGGCVCDSGEQPGCIENMSEGCLSHGCRDDGDCPEYERCVHNDCGGCVCAIVREYDCCPDNNLESSCPANCSMHSDCAGNMVCTRNDCGGCQCQPFAVPDWAQCFGNPKSSIDEACTEECRVDNDCSSSRRNVQCQRNPTCDGCRCCDCPPNDGSCLFPEGGTGIFTLVDLDLAIDVSIPSNWIELQLGELTIANTGLAFTHITRRVSQLMASTGSGMDGELVLNSDIMGTSSGPSSTEMSYRETTAVDDLEMARAYVCLRHDCRFDPTYAVFFAFTQDSTAEPVVTDGGLILVTDSTDTYMVMLDANFYTDYAYAYWYEYAEAGLTSINKRYFPLYNDGSTSVGCAGVFVDHIIF